MILYKKNNLRICYFRFFFVALHPNFVVIVICDWFGHTEKDVY